jgi:ABC-2 type transport system ATP-binding protein
MMLAAAALFGASLGWLLLVRPARPRTAAGPPDAPVLSVASLKVFYPAGWLRRRLEVVHGISLTLEAGKIVGLLGPNGAGKTSTFKGILGLADSEGTMTWAGGCSGRLTVVPENDFLPQVVRARDVLRTAGAVRKDGIVREFVRVLDVGSLLDTPLGRLSTGQRRRVHLLLGMLPGADVFLLDEPARSVDPLERQGVKELLRRVARRGAAVVIATHQLREFEELVDVVALIDDGRVLAHGPLPELRARHVILEAVGEGTEQGGRAVIHRRVGVAASLADQAEPELIAQGSTVVRREPTLEEVFELEVRRARENRDVDALPGRGRGLVFELGGAEPGAHGGAPGGQGGSAAERL